MSANGRRGRSRYRYHHVRHEPLVAMRVLAHDREYVAHRFVLCDHRLDLAELDAEAANLDLMVDAPEELDRAVART